MNSTENIVKEYGLEANNILHNAEPSVLVEQIIKHKEGFLTASGAVTVDTGKFTGRSPKDRYIVCDSITDTSVDWGEINIPFEPAKYSRLRERVLNYLKDKKIYSRDAYASAYEKYRLNVLLLSEKAYGSLFCYNLFLRPDLNLPLPRTDWTIIFAPGFLADPQTDGTRSSNFSIINFGTKEILIGGTGYTGEIKKGIFSVFNYLLPHEHHVLSMHCSANVGTDEDVALFFGLSGTGKTTLSSSSNRKLIGDDEHGWDEKHVFNIEGGCYAKCVNLTQAHEPEIWRAIKFGSLMENVRFIPNTRTVDYTDISVTENTRVSYPLPYIRSSLKPSIAGIPRNIFFLSADAFGVLPPISKLTSEQAKFYFLSGYTAKVAGTEAGINEPQATFSACFGKVFLPLHPLVYTKMLGDRISEHGISVWLINSGWIGGAYGTGERIKLPYTRSLLNAALQGLLDDVEYDKVDIFDFSIPTSCPDVPSEVLNPKTLWPNERDYLTAAKALAQMFLQNFAQYESDADPGLCSVLPRI